LSLSKDQFGLPPSASALPPSVILSLSKDQFRPSLCRMRDYFVYILSNNSQVLYIGVTRDLDGRLFEHIHDRDSSSFAARYNLDRLVFYEVYPTPQEAIAREKQLKGWTRERKKRLIASINPTWRNLLEGLKAGTIEIRDESKGPRTDPSTSSG
jgi:putative endonuclease